jgi:hypothetical protein
MKLLQMKSPIVAKIKCHFKKFEHEFKTVGIQFFYKDEPQPISFGTSESDMFHAAEFLTGQDIRKVRVSELFTVAEGDFRKISFYDRKGEELHKRKGLTGKEHRSIMGVYNCSMPQEWDGKDADIPAG